MSKEYENQDPLEIARQAEQDLNSQSAKTGIGAGSDSITESGVDESATSKSQFAGAEVTHGSAASGAGDNRDIPLSEGGDVDPKTGRLYKAGDFEGVGGPEDKARIYAENNPGDDEVGGNVRQQSNIKDSGGKSKESARPMVNPSGPGRT